MRPGNPTDLFYHIAKPLGFNFLVGDGTAEFDLAFSHLDYLPIAMPGPGLDINLLAYLNRVWSQNQHTIFSGNGFTVVRPLMRVSSHHDHSLGRTVGLLVGAFIGLRHH